MIYPKVLIAIPTFNRVNTIIETINSVCSQKYKNWEIIILDNASTDNTKKKIAEKFSNEPRIQYKYFSQHVSLHKNWERAYQYIDKSYKYFKYLCSDDLLDENFLDHAITSLENSSNKYYAYTSNVIYIRDKKPYKYRKYGFYGFEKIASLFFRNYVGCPSSMLLKTVGLIDFTNYPNFDYAGDIYQSLVYYSKNKKIFFGDKFLAYFQTNQQTSETNSMFGSIKMVNDKQKMRTTIIPMLFSRLNYYPMILLSYFCYILEFLLFSLYRLTK